MAESAFYNEESYEETYDEIVQHRDDAMDSLDKAEVETVDLLSEEIDEQLDPLSDYMQQAKEDSRKRGEEAGMLESGFLEGVGEVEAIDSVYDVARQNVYTDFFNADANNRAELERYISDFQNAYIEQGALDDSSLDQFSYGLEQESKARENQYKNYYQDLTDEYQTELLEQDSALSKSYNDLLQQFLLEESATSSTYQSALKDMERNYKAQESAWKRKFNEEFTDQMVSRFWEQQNMDYWLRIQTAHMLPSEKADALAKYYEQINKYSPDTYTPIVDPSDDIYNWDDTDTDGWTMRMNNRLETIQFAIEDQVDSSGRARESVPGYINSKEIINHFGDYRERFPEASVKVLQWFASNAAGVMDDENYARVIDTTAFLMQELQQSDGDFPWIHGGNTCQRYSEDPNEGSPIKNDCPVWDWDKENNTITKDGAPVDLLGGEQVYGVQI